MRRGKELKIGQIWIDMDRYGKIWKDIDDIFKNCWRTEKMTSQYDVTLA